MFFRSNKKSSDASVLSATYIENKYNISLSTDINLEALDSISIKGKKQVCERTLAFYLSLQLAFDIASNKDYISSRNTILEIVRENGIENYLTVKERNLMYGSYQMQDVLDVVNYIEIFYCLLWIIGLIDTETLLTIEAPCNIRLAIESITKYSKINDLYKKSKMRNEREIIDMTDLFNKITCSDLENSSIIKSIVDQRLMALKWVTTASFDFNEIMI
ncbi:MAG: DUF4272 domain-containing protein [Erysipelotrichaceae bacterium]